MKLYVMRHGAAEDAAASFHDFDRALTTKGRKRTKEVGRTLERANERPESLIASPLVRALQTAEILASVLEPTEPVVVRQELAPGGDALMLVQELLAAKCKSAMLVGHEPDLSLLLGKLIGSDHWSGPLQKSMVVGVRVESLEKTKLRFVLEPKSQHLHSNDA